MSDSQDPTAGLDKPWTAEPHGTWHSGWRPTAHSLRSGLRVGQPTIGMPWGLHLLRGSPGARQTPWCQNGPTTMSTARCFWTPWSGWTTTGPWCSATPPTVASRCCPPTTRAQIGNVCRAIRFPTRRKVKRRLPRPTATWLATATPCGSSQEASPPVASDLQMPAPHGPPSICRSHKGQA